METLQQSGVQPSERIVSLGSPRKASPATPRTSRHCVIVGFKGGSQLEPTGRWLKFPFQGNFRLKCELEHREVFSLLRSISHCLGWLWIGRTAMYSTLLCEFNVELSTVVPFPTPSEVLRIGTWRSFFSSAFQFSWPRMVVDWMNCYVHFCVNSMSSFQL